MTDKPSSSDPTPTPESLYDAATLFALLSATARLHIVWLLAGGERDVGTLAEATGHSVATVSQHLAKLKLGGVVRARRDGRRQVYLLDDPRVPDLLKMALDDRPEQTAAPQGRRRRA